MADPLSVVTPWTRPALLGHLIENAGLLINRVTLLLKRALIESVFSKIKLLGKFEHSRHRSVTNAFVHMVAALISYQLSDNKPSIKSLLQLQDFLPSNAKLALI